MKKRKLFVAILGLSVLICGCGKDDALTNNKTTDVIRKNKDKTDKERFIEETKEPEKEAEVKETKEPTKEAEVKETKEPTKEVEVKETKEPTKEVEVKETKEPTKEVEVKETKEPTKEVEVKETKEPTKEVEVKETKEPTKEVAVEPTKKPSKKKGNVGDTYEIEFNKSWEFAGNSVINSGKAVFYSATSNRKDITVAVNAGHGTINGYNVKTLCHPDGSAKTTGGSTAQGATTATAVSAGMTFKDGTSEAAVTLAQAKLFKDALLADGYDVVMLRDGDDVQLDNIARTIIANNTADCFVSIHWDGDNLSYDKGAFAIGVPESIRNMYPVSNTWQADELLGDCLEKGLEGVNVKLYKADIKIDLTQTSYSTIPTVDIEMGNQCCAHDDSTLSNMANGLLAGINMYYGK